MLKGKKNYKVIYGKDYIAVTRGKSEIVYWDKQEWIDDPEIVFSIANAVSLACLGKLEKFLKRRVKL